MSARKKLIKMNITSELYQLIDLPLEEADEKLVAIQSRLEKLFDEKEADKILSEALDSTQATYDSAVSELMNSGVLAQELKSKLDGKESKLDGKER